MPDPGDQQQVVVERTVDAHVAERTFDRDGVAFLEQLVHQHGFRHADRGR
jgi:hypothetical protein